MIEKLYIFVNLSIPYVYEEGFTTLEILKNVIKHLNEVIDEVNKIPDFEKNVNDEISKLNEKITTEINNLKDEIIKMFPEEFTTELNKAIENGTFDILLTPIENNITEIQSKITTIETDITNLKNSVSNLNQKVETLETKTETLENTTSELTENLATKIDDAPADNNTYGRNNNKWVQVTGGSGGGIPEAPIDDILYGRKNGTWNKIPDSINIYKTITDSDVPENNTVILNVNEIKNGNCIVINRSSIGTNTFIKFNVNSTNYLSLQNGIYQFINIDNSDNYIYIIGSNIDGIYFYEGTILEIRKNNELTFKLSDTKNIVYTNTTNTIYGTKTFTTTPKITKAPTTDEEATNKKYVDDSITTLSNTVNESITTLSNTVNESISTLSNSFDTKLTKYVDVENEQEISGLKTFLTIPDISGTPTTSDNATNKNYVDTKVQSAIAELNIDNYVDETSTQSISGLKTFTTLPKSNVFASDIHELANLETVNLNRSYFKGYATVTHTEYGAMGNLIGAYNTNLYEIVGTGDEATQIKLKKSGKYMIELYYNFSSLNSISVAVNINETNTSVNTSCSGNWGLACISLPTVDENSILKLKSKANVHGTEIVSLIVFVTRLGD